MSFSGEVSKKSHEGGILASFEGKPPSLGTNIRITGGKTLGRVQSVIGNIENPLIHIFPLSRGIDSLSAIGANIEIAPRDRTPKPKNNRGRGSDRNRFQKNNDNMKSGDWICPKCKTINQESYKFCMECADRNPKRGIEEIASGHSEPPAYRRKTEEEQRENPRKRKAEEEREIALKQKTEQEERIREENRRIKEWEDKFDLEQQKKEEELIKKFYDNQSTDQDKEKLIQNPDQTNTTNDDK